MIVYSWKIERLDAYAQTESQTNVVFCVHWRMFAQQDQYSAECYGTVDLQYTANGSYTPYEQLTQQQVIAWVEAALGDDKLQQYKDVLGSNIVNQINPPVVTPRLPWVV